MIEGPFEALLLTAYSSGLAWGDVIALPKQRLTYFGRSVTDTFQLLIKFPCITTGSRRPLGPFRNGLLNCFVMSGGLAPVGLSSNVLVLLMHSFQQ